MGKWFCVHAPSFPFPSHGDGNSDCAAETRWCASPRVTGNKKSCRVFWANVRFAARYYAYFTASSALFVWSFSALATSDRLCPARPVGGAVAMRPAEELSGQEATAAPVQVQFWLKMRFSPVLFVSIWSEEDKRIRNILLESRQNTSVSQFFHGCLAGGETSTQTFPLRFAGRQKHLDAALLTSTTTQERIVGSYQMS